jgi:hypothetical protein
MDQQSIYPWTVFASVKACLIPKTSAVCTPTPSPPPHCQVCAGAVGAGLPPSHHGAR